ncbi:Endonuclease [Actinidia chinensis var. chinensis]|uniref:Endonuclease n=1 Tax=Actinidia chinensis var. chinensis TaxID=1590841 RepID=A0A2R6P3S2_ACTCC|nr:Endonuclease [Actinidia chinensis var. chinensis]
MIEESRELDEEERAAKKKVKAELWQNSRLSESIWRQKSRINWLKLGDKNTKFFQTFANSRYRKNFIGSVEVDGVMLEDPNLIKSAAIDYFSKLFDEETWTRPRLGGMAFGSLDATDRMTLEKTFLEEEIVRAIKDCSSFKAPGPDGFNLGFVKKAWKILRHDCLEFFFEFHKNGRLVKGLNATFIALIPKVEGPLLFKDFRPIGMVGWLYKILAKVLATRLKSVLPKVISESQSAFLGGRQILDGVLIANELIHDWRVQAKQGLIFKVDFTKAYDCVNWTFLKDMNRMLGCGLKWCQWIDECISTASMSILLNGSATKEFKSKRGIRQGDPLSPFLFNIVAEALNILFQRAIEAELIKGVSLNQNTVRISHLQFADDAIFFCQNDRNEVVTIKRILCCFELISGLKINFSKSMIVGVNIPEAEMNEIAGILKCKAGELPLTYLGLPLGANPRRIKTWNPIMDRFKNKLASWKMNYISIGGRISLIKSTLSNLAIFFMSLFKMPMTVAQELEKIQRQFLWGDSEGKKKLHFLSWETVIRRKEAGGLGIKQLLAHNSALLAKWWWRFGSEKNALWYKVIAAKYGYSCDQWLPSLPNTGSPSPLWSAICSLGSRDPIVLDLLQQGFQIRLRDGARTKFWEDSWCGGRPLKEEFPRLFLISTNKTTKVKDLFVESEFENSCSCVFIFLLASCQLSMVFGFR